MAVTNLAGDLIQVDTTLDSITIRQHLSGILGGVSLDVTGYTLPTIQSGHVIIKATATGDFKPMPVSDDAYGELPEGHTIEGVAVQSVLTSKAMVGVMTRGEVNEATSPFAVTTAIKEALPLIIFTKDAKK